jgi:hypothetical protein
MQDELQLSRLASIASMRVEQGVADITHATPLCVPQATSASLQSHKQGIIALVGQLTARLKSVDTLIQCEVRPEPPRGIQQTPLS